MGRERACVVAMYVVPMAANNGRGSLSIFVNEWLKRRRGIAFVSC